MPQTNQNKVGILFPNGSTPVYDSLWALGDRGVGGGGDYTFTGTGFGTKSSTPQYESFESQPLGQVGNIAGAVTISEQTDISISTNRAYIGTKSLFISSYVTNYFPKTYITLSGSRPRLYASCRLYVAGDISLTGVWKMWRVGSPLGTEYGGVPRAGESWTTGGGGAPAFFGGEIVNSDGTTSWDIHNSATGNPATYGTGRWMFCEVEFYAGTVNSSNAVMKARVDGVEVLNWSNRPYLTSANSELPDWLLLPCQGMDNHPNCSANWDNIYVDESNARVVFTDNATYASSTKWDVQPITSYSDTSISVTKVTPSFAGGSTVHAHLFRDNGSYVYLGTRMA